MQFTIETNTAIAPDVYRMRLLGDTSEMTRPGQFVQVAVPGLYLRRPISVCDWRPGEHGTLDIVYKVVGHGTEKMSAMRDGMELDLLIGLGNGYDIEAAGADKQDFESPLLIGGGVGTPPLYALCKQLLAAGKEPTMVLGFGCEDEIFLRAEFEALGVQVIVCTADGTCGVKGFVTHGMEGLEGRHDYVYACGPEAMLKAVHQTCEGWGMQGQYSFEERMACGFGVCMGCSCQTKYGSKRICKDGPVLRGEEIVW